MIANAAFSADRHSLAFIWVWLLALPRRLQSRAVFQWIVRFGSKPFELTDLPAIIFAPHQDDEVLGCGGLIALKRERNVPVQVVFLTDGAKTPIPGKSGSIYSGLRENEALAATTILGVERSSVHFLNAPDGKLGALTPTANGELLRKISSLLVTRQPLEIYVSHGWDCHPDHEAAFRLVEEAIRDAGIAADLNQYLIWMPWSGKMLFRLKYLRLSGARRLGIDKVLGVKRRAILAYGSQLKTLPFGFLARFQLPVEVFFRK